MYPFETRAGRLSTIVGIAAALLVQSRVATAQAVKPCRQGEDYVSLTLAPGNPFVLDLVLANEAVLRAEEPGSAGLLVKPSLKELHVATGRRWHIVADSKTCRFDFASLWRTQGAAPKPIVLGLAEGRIPDEVLIALFRLERSEEEQRIGLLLAAGIAPAAGVGVCPKGDAVTWTPGSDLILKALASSAGPSRLLIQLDAAGRECALIANLQPDARLLTVQVGGEKAGYLEASYDTASLLNFPQIGIQTPTFEDSSITCSVRVSAGSNGVTIGSEAPEECRPQVTLAQGSVSRSGVARVAQRRRVPHRRPRIFMRVLPTEPLGRRCPDVPPAKASRVAIFGETAYACLYLDDGDGDPSLVSSVQFVGDFEIAPCRRSGAECSNATPPALPKQVWTLGAKGAVTGEVALRVRKRSSDASIFVQPVKVVQSALWKKRQQHDRVYVSSEDEVLDALCVPAFQGEDAALEPMLRASVGDNPDSDDNPGMTSWKRKNEQLCPNEGLPVYLGDKFDVKFSLGTTPFLSRTVIIGDALALDSIQAYSGLDAPDEPVTTFRASGLVKKTLQMGEWLCARIDDTAVDGMAQIRVSPDTFKFEDALTHDSSAELAVIEEEYGGPLVLLKRKSVTMKSANGPRRQDLFCARVDGRILSIEGGVIEDSPEKLLVRDVKCRDQSCTNSFSHTRWFSGLGFGLAMAPSLQLDLDGTLRAGYTFTIPVLQLGYRVSPKWSLVVQAGLGFAFSGVVSGDPEYDAAEAQSTPGTCVAGCDEVQDTQTTIDIGPYMGPCVRFNIRPQWFSIPLCVDLVVTGQANVREGAGVYQTADGRISKVGERGDTAWRIAQAARLSLGIAVTLGDY